ncbi:ATP-binding protein [Flavobacterium sp. LB2P53]|uniref:ATP-binding protein n=1 Tax=Flavobacterium sp. LB2P53 TaxID=2497481 RepID=UPI000F849761|nr:ATP-binding protein [Flavobacterium sp. LB2P53]RTY65548.1 ATP-binding protein [Flavobacterium sp. LB2P53]
MTEILTDDWLSNFFEIADANNILKRRESHWIEFKSVFDWKNEKARSGYCKSLAAFSNNKGGALFFGIEDKPHKIIGISNFEDIDDADITNYINELFTPSIHFERTTFNFRGLTIGVLYAFNSKYRPIICNKDSAKTFSSDIYFRYGAKSTKIKSGDLLKLIEEVKEVESNKWMKLFENIGKIGIENIHLLNSVSGEIISENNTFLLDENLLSQIKIIDRFSIQEEGQPAVRIIGNIPELARVIKKTTVIYEEDIYKAYLLNLQDLRPDELLKFICQGNTSHYPFYFLIKRMYPTIAEGKQFLSNVKIVGFVRKLLIERINFDKKSENHRNRFTLNKLTKYGPSRNTYLNYFQNKEEFEIENEENIKRILESVFSLVKGQFDIDFTKNKLNEVFENHYPFEKGATNYLFRDAITFLDFIEK